MISPVKNFQLKLYRKSLPYINKAKEVSLPGFDKVPLYNVGLFFFKGIINGAINRRASAVAFSLILALFPAIIFIFTMIPLIPVKNFQTEMLLFIQELLPETAYAAVQKVIEDIITIKHGGFLSLGFAMALIFSTNGILSLIQSFNQSVNVTETRSWLMQRAIALLLIFILSLLLTIGISLITFTQIFLNYLVQNDLMKQDWTYYLVIFGKWIIIIAVFFFAYSFLYYLGPARKSKFRFISAGGTLATILSIIITLGFGFYIDHFGKYNALYGSIGALPIVMLMVQLNCLAIIVGFELNIGIVAARKLHLEKQ
ncbi:MAG: YihY/virulence factor BrkB family protein [Prolixibacteraceae bacterium]|nr:YihY/virulence factor BrkB family protein [Prolixibacteraceae bacterium]